MSGYKYILGPDDWRVTELQRNNGHRLPACQCTHGEKTMFSLPIQSFDVVCTYLDILSLDFYQNLHFDPGQKCSIRLNQCGQNISGIITCI